MFVFPAFNSNYNHRKRTFKCCRKCRAKRMKCIIQSANYDVVGCDNCRDNNTICDLITNPPTSFDQLQARFDEKRVKLEPQTQVFDGKRAHPEPQAPFDGKRAHPEPQAASTRTHLEPQATAHTPAHTPAPVQPHLEGLAASPPPITPLTPAPAPSRSAYVPYSTPAPQPYYQYMPPQYNGPQFMPNLPQIRPPVAHYLPPVPQHHAYPIHQPESVPSSVSAPPSDPLSVQQQVGTPAEVAAPTLTTNEMNTITGEYLRDQFGFIIKMQKAKYLLSSGPKPGRNAKNPAKNDEKSTKIPLKKNPDHIKNPVVYRFLVAIHAFTLNTPGVFEISPQDLCDLIKLYFFKINSIFPIIQENEFWDSFHNDSVPSIIIYAIVLTMARDPCSKPILTRSFKTLDPHGPNSSYNDCMVDLITQLELKIRQLLLVLPELGDDDKFSRLVCQLLLVFNFNFNKLGNERSSQDLTDCINYGMVLIIHLSFFHTKIQAQGMKEKSEYLQNLWWIMFIFDRFNAMMNSRAMFIKREDFSIPRPTNPTLLKLVDASMNLENMLVSLYRPVNNHGDGRKKEEEQFNPEKFILDELEISDNNELLIHEFRVFHDENFENNEEDRKFDDIKQYIPKNINLTRYRERVVFFIERSISNIIMFIFRSAKLRLEQKVGNDQMCLKISDNILKLWKYFTKDQNDLELSIHISLIPLALSLGFRVPLTYKLRVLSAPAANHTVDSSETIRKIGVVFNGYVKELERLSDKWWYLKEVMGSIRSFNRRVNNQAKRKREVVEHTPSVAHTANSGSDMAKSTSNSSSNDNNEEDNRDKLKIDSLIENGKVAMFDVDRVPTVSSPSYYTEVIELMAGDEDEEDEEEQKTKVKTEEEEIPVVPIKQEVEMNLQPYEPGISDVENHFRPSSSAVSEEVPSNESWSSYDDLAMDANKFIEMLNNDIVPDIFEILGGPPFAADNV